ncbi:MAG: hypothetical protein WA009_13935 [Phototrophicaceae bacterium]|nr:hypothetical protein [Anaerolineae bacterium]
MRRLLVLTAVCLMAWSIVAFFVVERQVKASEPLPTLMVLPSLTPSRTATQTATAARTPTPSATWTATATPTQTATSTATPTPTLSTRVLEIHAVMPGVIVPPTATGLPAGTIVLPAPPLPFEPLPDATDQPPPYAGWISYESDHPDIRYSTPWERRQQAGTSRGQYHRSDEPDSAVSMVFDGEGLRIRYVAARNMGVFNVIVDGAVIDTVDAYSSELAFPGTQVYSLGAGPHVLTLRSADERNPDSEGSAIALDAVQVYRAGLNTIIGAPPAMPPLTDEPRDAARIERVSAPQVVLPIITPMPPAQMIVSVVIAYDENGNRAVDPAEGVSGIPVRVVEAGTNRVIAQAFTDVSGYAQIQLVTDTPVRVAVPYFGKVWSIPNGRRGGNVRFTHLLAPGNQPGLIP